MSLASRERSCAACGREFEPGEGFDIEPLIDQGVRYLAVHKNHSTFSSHHTFTSNKAAS
jgi:hypothetical protein